MFQGAYLNDDIQDDDDHQSKLQCCTEKKSQLPIVNKNTRHEKADHILFWS